MSLYVTAIDISKKPELLQVAKKVRDTRHAHVLKSNDEPVAAVVPLDVYEQWEKAGDELLAIMDTAVRKANLSSKEADQLADEAVRSIRTGSQAA